MALEKVEVLAIGPNSIRNNTSTSRVFSSNIQMDLWSATVTYNADDCVELSGNVWKALSTHINQSPTLVSAYWIPLIVGVHDSDIGISTTGTIDIRQRISGSWMSISNRPFTTTLLNNVAVPTEIFQYSAASFKDAFIEYEISRGNGNTEGGTLRILTDGSSIFNYAQDFTWLLGDPAVALIISISASNIIVSYTSANQSSPITFKYSLRAW